MSDTMRKAIGNWLDPMIAGLDERADINMQVLLDGATIVTRPDKPRARWLPRVGHEEERSVDWVRFGQLLREALGWDDYPEAPPD